MNLNTRLHILGHVALKLAALAGALGGLLLITTIMLPPRAAQASSPDLQATIAGGYEHTCALKGGQVYCWGANGYGQLGDNSTTNRITPTLVADGAMGNSGVTAVAAGHLHTCAIKSGALYCWGYNGYGQLGNGTNANSTTPVAVTNMGSGVTAVAAGRHHTCAIKSGALYCWGYNGYGELGNGTTTGSNTPTLVADGAMGNSGVTAVAAGGWHTCAIKSGALYCWGGNWVGQLGASSSQTCGGYACSTTPLAVTSMNSDVTAVAAGYEHTCAIKSGALYCWGYNGYGQLGNGTTTGSNTPVAVTNMGSGAAAVAAGWYHTCALKGGQVYCWGLNGNGQLGNGTNANSTTPVAVTNMGSGAAAVAAGWYHTLGLKDTTCLFAWGRNDYGQLGDGGTTNRTTPVQVSGGCGWGTPPPAPFSKTAPVSGATGLPTTVVLSWTAPASGTLHHYRYCLATTPGCAPSTQVVSTTTSVTVTGLTPGATYHWQVRACANSACDVFTDANGSGGHWSFTVAAVGPFSKAQPVSGATGLPTTVVLSWTAPATGTLHHYRYCLATTPGCAPVTQVVSTTTSVTVTGLSPATTYYWQVRACATSDCAAFTDADGSGGHWAFTVAAVGPFSKAQPVSGATNLPTTVVLGWTAPATGTVDHYRYCLATTPGCTPVTPTTATSATLTGLTPLTTYYWQVRACATSDCAAFTDANGSGGHWSFTVAPLEPFGKLEPAHGATGLPFAANNIQLRWEAMTYATAYEVCIGTLPDACDVLSWQNLGNATQWTINFPLASAASYWWQVRAVMGSTQVPADSGQAWRFVTANDAAPGSFRKTGPLNGTTGVPTVANTTRLTWTVASGATGYQICLGTLPGACDVLGWLDVGNVTAWTVNVGLQPATAYWWQVRATSGGGSNRALADGGHWWHFVTVNSPAPPGPLGFGKRDPVYGLTGLPATALSVTLGWISSSNATGYQVCLGALPGGCDVLGWLDVGNVTNWTITIPLRLATMYWWQVRAVNASGHGLADGGQWWPFVTANSTAPGGFGKLEPANGAVGLPFSGAQLKWGASSGANNYYVCVGSLPGVCDAVNWVDVGAATDWTINVALQPATMYWWQVRAHSPSGQALADGGHWWSFVTANSTAAGSPGSFGKSGPAHGATGLSFTAGGVQLSWGASSGAARYEVCVGTTLATCDVVNWQPVNATNLTLNFLLQPATVYWWQVRAVNNTGQALADGGRWWYFATTNSTAAGSPGRFAKVAPLNGATDLPAAANSITLRWISATGATAYQVCLGTLAGGCDVLSWLNVGNVLSWTVNLPLQAGTAYWWQVRAVNASGQALADSGQHWYFVTANPSAPGGFDKRAPANGATQQPSAANSVQLSWESSSGATGYQACVGSLPGDCDVVNWVNVGNVTNWTINVPLRPGTTYWWQVRATSGSARALADGGRTWFFVTANSTAAGVPGGFGKLVPANGASGLPVAANSIQLGWSAASNATGGYRVCVGTLPGSCDVVNWQSVGTLNWTINFPLLPAMTYWWQVQAVNVNGQVLADGGQAWYFTTANSSAPGSPQSFGKIEPSNGSNGLPFAANSIDLTWSNSVSATNYQVCVGTLPGICDVVNWVDVGDVTNWVLNVPLRPAASYWWSVRATSPSGQALADGGQPWYFATQPSSDPGTPVNFGKLGPANGTLGLPFAPNSIQLSWGLVSNADGYQVCLGTSAGACNVIGWQNVSGLSWTIDFALQPATIYWWQVRAVNSNGQRLADGGQWWYFVTASSTAGNVPGNFGKSGPASGASGLNPAAGSIQLSWGVASQADGYQVCVGTAPGNCDVVNWLTVSGLNWTINVALQPATAYWWQVRAVNSNGQRLADGGQWWYFVTASSSGGGAPDNFGKSGPSNGANGLSTAANTVQLSWGSAGGATAYEVCIGTLFGACDVLNWHDVGNALSWLIDFPLQPATSYWWQMRAVNGNGQRLADGGQWWSFTTANGDAPGVPGGFGKSGPANGASGLSTAVNTVQLSWGSAANATGYQVCLGTGPGLCDVVTWQPVGNVLNWTINQALQPATAYWWQVRAANANGQTLADGGQWWSFTTANSSAPGSPGNFTKSGPADGANGLNFAANSIQLSWNNALNASSYQVCVGTLPGACDTVNWLGVNGLNWTINFALQPATAYWWQVRAVNGNGQTLADGGQWWSFTTANSSAPGAPGVFGKSGPANGASGVSFAANTVQLSWGSAANATGYQVCLGTAPNVCNVLGWQGVGSALTWTVNIALQPATAYWWQVRAVNGNGQTLADGGQWWSFTTANSSAPEAPGVFGKRGPSNGANGVSFAAGTVQLSWGSAANATGYQVCLGTGPSLCNLVNWQSVGNALNWTINFALQPATAYWWQVRAVNANGQALADGGQPWYFSTANSAAFGAPAGFGKSMPANGANGLNPAANSIQLSWNSSGSATGYRVCVGTLAVSCDVVDWQNVGNVTNWTINVALQPATAYWWQVRAVNSAGQALADGGQWWYFSTAGSATSGSPGSFVKVLPTSGAENMPFDTGGLALLWSSAANAASYQVCLGTLAGLCNVLNWQDVGNTPSWTNNFALQPATTYWWQVRAVNANGRVLANNGHWWHFATASSGSPGSPGPFGKQSPAVNADNVLASVTLFWGASSNATSYQVCVGLAPGNCGFTGGWVNTSATSYNLSGLALGTTYWWQVRAINAGGETAADGGIWWQFTTQNPFTLIQPFGKIAPLHQVNGQPSNVTLSWNPATGAARFTVCVGTQPGLCNVVNHAETTNTFLALSGLQTGQTYWWQVFAHNGAASRQADNGQWWSFNVSNGSGPGAFAKQSPTNGAGVFALSAVNLTWTPASGVLTYRVCIGTALGLCNVVDTLTANTAVIWTPSRAGRFWWQVTAIDSDGNTTQADGGTWWVMEGQPRVFIPIVMRP
jgi:alpha-tubulin suppressor-like RCC1 family protein